MRTLIVGAGAVGGYIGACLQRADRDVSYLVRTKRAAQLAAGGLRGKGPCWGIKAYATAGLDGLR